MTILTIILWFDHINYNKSNLINFYTYNRSALGIDKALEEMQDNKGELYDPAAADACLRLFKEREFRF